MLMTSLLLWYVTLTNQRGATANAYLIEFLRSVVHHTNAENHGHGVGCAASRFNGDNGFVRVFLLLLAFLLPLRVAPGPAPAPARPASPAPTPAPSTAPQISISNQPDLWLQTGWDSAAYWMHDDVWGAGNLTRGTYTGLNG